MLSLSGGRGVIESSGARSFRGTPATKTCLRVDLEDIVPEGTGLIDNRTLARSLEETCCGVENCGGKNKIFHFSYPRGSPAPIFHLICRKCHGVLEISTGRTQRLFKYPASLEQTAQGKSVEGILWVLSALFAGDTFADYQTVSDSLGLHGVGSAAFGDAINYIAPFVESTLNTSITVARYCSVVHGRIDDLTSTFDVFWLTRGHHSMHGSGSLNDFRLRLVIGFMNMTKAGELGKSCGSEKFHGSSGAMEPAIFRKLLQEINHWLKEDAADLLKLAGLSQSIVAEHTYCILDGDSDCHKVLEEESPHTRLLRCCNHQNKCTGKFCLKCKDRWNKGCDCLLKTKKDGKPYKNKARDHRTIPAGFAKKVQVNDFILK